MCLERSVSYDLVVKRRLRYLDMLLEVLGSLEGLAAELALVRLQGNVNANVACDVIALDRGRAARVPTAGQVQVICALATDMALADVLVEGLGGGELLVAGLVVGVPAAGEIVVGSS